MMSCSSRPIRARSCAIAARSRSRCSAAAWPPARGTRPRGGCARAPGARRTTARRSTGSGRRHAAPTAPEELGSGVGSDSRGRAPPPSDRAAASAAAAGRATHRRRRPSSTEREHRADPVWPRQLRRRAAPGLASAPSENDERACGPPSPHGDRRGEQDGGDRGRVADACSVIARSSQHSSSSSTMIAIGQRRASDRRPRGRSPAHRGRRAARHHRRRASGRERRGRALDGETRRSGPGPASDAPAVQGGALAHARDAVPARGVPVRLRAAAVV